MSDIPRCWTVNQAQRFLSEYPWLIIKSGKFKCGTCSAVKTLGVLSSASGVSIQTAWCEGTVTATLQSGDKHAEQKLSRNKIYRHRDSDAHKLAESALDRARKRKLVEAFGETEKSANEQTERVFRLVYKEAKNGRSFNSFSDEIDVAEANGANVGRVLHTNVSCANITDHLAEEMRKRLCKQILSVGSKMAVLVDESTSISKNTCSIIYIRVCIEPNGNPRTVFLDLVELESSGSTAIKDAVLHSLEEHGFNMDYLKKHLIAFGCDGASVMLGRKTGVAKLLMDLFPQLIVWHCAAHRLELGVADTVRQVAGTNSFKSFMDKLYSLYSMSPKNSNELENAAREVSVQLLKVGRVLSTRWVASSFRTVHAVINNFAALHRHFLTCSDDAQRDSVERQKYRGLANYLTSRQFVLNLGLMHDCLTELSEVSLVLQARETDLSLAHNIVVRTIKIFEARTEQPGPTVTAIQKELEASSTFKNVCVKEASKAIPQISPSAFYRAMAENLRSRLLATRASQRSTYADDISDEGTYFELLKDIKVMNPQHWPDEEDSLYGEDSITRLSNRFLLPSRDMINGFREFREAGGKKIPDKLYPLDCAIKTLPISTAECERGFSAMNRICTRERSSLATSRLSNLLWIWTNGPPVQMFRPGPYVRSWATNRHRLATDRGCMSRKKPKYDSDEIALWNIM